MSRLGLESAFDISTPKEDICTRTLTTTPVDPSVSLRIHSSNASLTRTLAEQQITLYPHRDDNNIWLLLNSTVDPNVIFAETHSPPKPIVDRSVIVLSHVTTNKKLHSHDVRAMVTEVDYQNEVSAYGFDGFEGDANDHFMVEIDQLTTEGKTAQSRLQALRTNFRLRHVMTGCYLFSHKVKLPDWGFEQQEVTCNKNPSKENGLWYIETNTHGGRTFIISGPVAVTDARSAVSPDAPRVNYRKPGFFSKFAELQAVMWQTNAGLTDRHAYDSRPATWPFLKRGINLFVFFPRSSDRFLTLFAQLGQGSSPSLSHRKSLRVVDLDGCCAGLSRRTGTVDSSRTTRIQGLRQQSVLPFSSRRLTDVVGQLPWCTTTDYADSSLSAGSSIISHSSSCRDSSSSITISPLSTLPYVVLLVCITSLIQCS